MKPLHTIGRRVGIDNGISPNRAGVIRGHSVVSGYHGKPKNHTELFYVVELDEGFYDENQNFYVSLVLIHPDNVEVV